MTNVYYNDGKIHGWNGGDCPVHPKSRVRAWYRNGSIMNGEQANNLTWEVDPEDDDNDEASMSAFTCLEVIETILSTVGTKCAGIFFFN